MCVGWIRDLSRAPRFLLAMDHMMIDLKLLGSCSAKDQAEDGWLVWLVFLNQETNWVGLGVHSQMLIAVLFEASFLL